MLGATLVLAKVGHGIERDEQVRLEHSDLGREPQPKLVPCVAALQPSRFLAVTDVELAVLIQATRYVWYSQERIVGPAPMFSFKKPAVCARRTSAHANGATTCASRKTYTTRPSRPPLPSTSTPMLDMAAVILGKEGRRLWTL